MGFSFGLWLSLSLLFFLPRLHSVSRDAGDVYASTTRHGGGKRGGFGTYRQPAPFPMEVLAHRDTVTDTAAFVAFSCFFGMLEGVPVVAYSLLSFWRRYDGEGMGMASCIYVRLYGEWKKTQYDMMLPRLCAERWCFEWWDVNFA